MEEVKDVELPEDREPIKNEELSKGEEPGKVPRQRAERHKKRSTKTRKAEGSKSKFKRWMKYPAIQKKYDNTERLLRYHKRTMSEILNGAIPNDKGYHPVSETMLNKILRDKRISPRKRPYSRILRSIHSLERYYGIGLLVNLPKYDWKAQSITKYLSFQLESNRLINLSAKRNVKKPLMGTSKTYPPLDLVDLEDITSDLRTKESVFLEMLDHFGNRYYPTVVKYRYHPRRKGRRRRKLLLLFIPIDLNPSRLSKLYGIKKFTRIWEGFYGKEVPKGRTEAHKAEQTIEKAMRELEKGGKITPGTPMAALPKLIERESRALHRLAPNRWGKYEATYIEKNFRPDMREQREKMTKRGIRKFMKDMAEKMDISRMEDNKLILPMVKKWKMSPQFRVRFEKEFLDFIRKEKRKYGKRGTRMSS